MVALPYGKCHGIIGCRPDIGLLEDGYLTTDSFVPIRSIFSTVGIEPLGIDDVHKMLESRYRHLRRDSDAEVRPLTLDDIRPVLQERYANQLSTLPEQARVDQLIEWGESDPYARNPPNRSSIPQWMTFRSLASIIR